MKSGNLNFLEPSGPLQACNGTALPLPFTSGYIVFIYFIVLDMCNGFEFVRAGAPTVGAKTCFNYQLNAQFLYSIIYVLHYNPRHVSSNTMLILRRSKLYCYSIWYRHSAVECTGWERTAVRSLTESDNTRCCNNIILTSWGWA
jgi:hypothetical protein